MSRRADETGSSLVEVSVAMVVLTLAIVPERRNTVLTGEPL
jgi:hypothetical protein